MWFLLFALVGTAVQGQAVGKKQCLSNAIAGAHKGDTCVLESCALFAEAGDCETLLGVVTADLATCQARRTELENDNIAFVERTKGGAAYPFQAPTDGSSAFATLTSETQSWMSVQATTTLSFRWSPRAGSSDVMISSDKLLQKAFSFAARQGQILTLQVAIETMTPTTVPTSVPTEFPTSAPTVLPTSSPTAAPTDLPTNSPTMAYTGIFVNDANSCVSWTDYEANTYNELPRHIWMKNGALCTANDIRIAVEFADGTESWAEYTGMSGYWESSFPSTSPSSASGWLANCKVHYLYRDTNTRNLPMAWSPCTNTYSNNFDLDKNVAYGSNFRANRSGWNWAKIETCCDPPANGRPMPTPSGVFLNDANKCVSWTDYEANTYVELPRHIWLKNGSQCTSNSVRIGVEFADGTEGHAVYDNISSYWDSSFSCTSPTSGSGFLSSCTVHYLFRDTNTRSLPMAWCGCTNTWSNNFDLDTNVAYGGNFRASKSGWNWAKMETCCM